MAIERKRLPQLFFPIFLETLCSILAGIVDGYTCGAPIAAVIHNTNTRSGDYSNLKDSYLFFRIAQKTKAYLEEHPGAHLYRMGIGDVSLPLAPAVIAALHAAVEDQAQKETFHGYMPECGAPFLREAIAATK